MISTGDPPGRAPFTPRPVRAPPTSHGGKRVTRRASRAGSPAPCEVRKSRQDRFEIGPRLDARRAIQPISHRLRFPSIFTLRELDEGGQFSTAGRTVSRGARRRRARRAVAPFPHSQPHAAQLRSRGAGTRRRKILREILRRTNSGRRDVARILRAVRRAPHVTNCEPRRRHDARIWSKSSGFYDTHPSVPRTGPMEATGSNRDGESFSETGMKGVVSGSTSSEVSEARERSSDSSAVKSSRRRYKCERRSS
jgi:hypothetical protein